jgi:elongation factor P--(R)-beta-lysine ligase
MPARVLGPSDVTRAGTGTARIGGRVLAAEPTRLVVTDALARLTALGSAFEAAPGDLVVLSGRLERGVLTRARVLERTPAPEPRGDGEVNRFCLGGTASRLRERARAIAEIRAYFAEEAFLEVETPIRVRAPGVDSHVDAIRSERSYLITSPELAHKRLLVGGIPRLFELARVLRADEQGTLHEPEFLLLEWYRAFAGYESVMADTERLVARVARRLRRRAELVTPDGRRLDARPPFPRISMRDAFRRYAGVKDAADLAASDENRYFELLVSLVEPRLAGLDRPVFIVDYPLSQAALARPSASDPSVAERFELYAGGVELSNGYGELTDPDEQARRFRAERAARKRAKRPVYPIDERFLSALREGMPPSGGNALGVDRLVMLATGAKSIAEVVAFPAGT